jgi:hypothetical protein
MMTEVGRWRDRRPNDVPPTGSSMNRTVTAPWLRVGAACPRYADAHTATDLTEVPHRKIRALLAPASG